MFCVRETLCSEELSRLSALTEFSVTDKTIFPARNHWHSPNTSPPSSPPCAEFVDYLMNDTDDSSAMIAATAAQSQHKSNSLTGSSNTIQHDTSSTIVETNVATIISLAKSVCTTSNLVGFLSRLQRYSAKPCPPA